MHLASHCPCCGTVSETIDHLFVSSPVASAVWDHFGRQFGILPNGARGVSSSLMSWVLSHRWVSLNHIRVIVPVVILWCIWYARNKAKFEGVAMRAQYVIWQVGNLIARLGDANSLFRSFRGDEDCVWARRQGPPGLRRRPLLVAWDRPPPLMVKLNTDACVKSSRACCGGLARSCEGKVIFAFYKEFGEANVLLVEDLALLWGLQLCLDRGLLGFAAEVDSKTLVLLVKSGTLAPWPLCNTLRKIRSLISSSGASLSHAFRQANMAADTLASSRLGADVIFHSEEPLPARVKRVLMLDRQAVPYIRR